MDEWNVQMDSSRYSTSNSYDKCLVRTVPANKDNKCCKRIKHSHSDTSIEDCRSNDSVNKEKRESKKERTESEINTQPEYKLVTIKPEPQLNFTSNTNQRNSRTSKPRPVKTRLEVTERDWNTADCSDQYSCGQCSASFRTLADIKAHLESHLHPSFACDKCPETFITLRQLNRHSLLKHLTKCDIKCNICHKSLKSNRNLRLHLRTHTGERPFVCKQCGKRFTQNGSLQTHIKIHLGLKEHVCGYCSKAFIEYKNMKNHERTHTKERPFECRLCGKRFGDSSALIRHVRTHTGNKIYQCSLCPMKFSDPSGLTAHKKRHDGVKSYSCDFCDKKFTTQYILLNHESSIHMKTQNFTCEFCNKDFTLKQYLKNHIVRMHMQMVCDTCKTKFYSSKHLEKHKSKGCMKDKYTCDCCGERFSLKIYLRRHMEKKHFEPLYCHVCFKKYYSDYDLQKHKLKKRCAKKRSKKY